MHRLSILFLLIAVSAKAQYAPPNAEWNRPIEPFRIVGNVYYVGASDVSAFLITTSEGHILLDTGFRETVPIVEAGIRKLGFRVEDVRLLLASHGHYDHAGGVAEMKAKTKARFLTNPREVELFARGGKGDFAVFACSLTAPGYQLVGNRLYPEIVQDFQSSFAKLRALPCDIFLGGHSWDFGLEAKRKVLQSGAGGNPFIDPEGYRSWLDRSEDAFRKQLEAQRRP